MADNSNVSEARYSAINAMHQCRLWAWLDYKKKLHGYKNPFAKLGTVIHDILEDYAKYCISNKLDTDYDEFDKIKFKHLVKLEENQYSDAINILNKIKNTFNWENYLSLDKIEVERRFYLNKNLEPVKENEVPYFSGAIDLCYIDQTIGYIEDYKTVRAIYTKTYMKDSLQKLIYSYLMLVHYPQLEEVKFLYNFVRYGYKSDWYTLHRDALEETKIRIQEEVNELENLLNEEDPPLASPGGHCVLCQNKAHCESYQNAFDNILRIESEEDAINLYQKYIVAKLKISDIEKTLKKWIDDNKPIKLKNEEYGPKKYDKFEYEDTLKVIEILKKAGVPDGAIYDKLSFSNTDITKLGSAFKLSKEVKESIQKVATKSAYTKFISQKIEEENIPEETLDTMQDQNTIIIDPFL